MLLHSLKLTGRRRNREESFLPEGPLGDHTGKNISLSHHNVGKIEHPQAREVMSGAVGFSQLNKIHNTHKNPSSVGWRMPGTRSYPRKSAILTALLSQGDPPDVTPSQTPLWQVGKAKFVRISRGFPLETEFPRA